MILSSHRFAYWWTAGATGNFARTAMLRHRRSGAVPAMIRPGSGKKRCRQQS